MNKLYSFGLLAATVFFISCGNNGNDGASNDVQAPPPAPAINFAVAGTHKHDTSFFTEGLEFYKNNLIESTGLEGKSKLVVYNMESGKVEKEIALPATSFGEGVTVFRDTIYQLTYRESKVFVYNTALQKIKELSITGEGWGLTHDSTSIIASNGSNNLYYYEPGTFKLLKKVPVNENDLPAVNINELEYVNGFIYANQWQMNYILKIDPATGNVVAKMDLSSVIQQEKATNPTAEFINGIAYNPTTKKFYITGKNWAKIYELQFAF